MRIAALVLLVSLAAPATAFARPGDGDLSFGGAGRTAFTAGAGSARVAGLALRPDGRAVVAGTALEPGGGAATSVTQLLPNGALDGSFGDGGTVLADPVATAEVQPAGLALAPDGSAVAVTTVAAPDSGRLEVHVVRVLADGRPDRAFGTDGVAVLDFENGNVRGEDVALDDLGRVLIAASTDRDHARYMSAFRLTPDGQRDATFAGGRVDLNSRSIAGAILPRPGGGAYVAGGTLRRYGNITAVEVDDRGRRVDRFAGGRAAVRLTDRTREGTGARDMVFGPGGSLIVAAQVRPLGGRDRIAAVRLTRFGHLDHSFGRDGRFTAGRPDRPLTVHHLTRDGRGRLLLAGSAKNAASGGESALVVRLTPRGLADGSFGSGGAVVRRLGGVPGERFVDSRASAVAVEAGRVWVAGVAFDDVVDPLTDLGRAWPAVMRLLG